MISIRSGNKKKIFAIVGVVILIIIIVSICKGKSDSGYTSSN